MFIVNLEGKETIFEQIRDQIAKFVKLGILKPGDKLPSVRSLATDLGINPNTVQRAYVELEKAGVIFTLNKKGAFVAGSANKASYIDDAIRNLMKDGVSKEDLLKTIEEIYGGKENA
ncbi:MAG: GntR family transcriptional regulator [Erysipelotrichaceae bacterium]|nr:GntR family transcriptional regulator [Erysipelotrichaceae bacterium]